MIGIPRSADVDAHQHRRSAEGPPRPLAELPVVRLASVLGLMTDIDDTLTRDGAIEPAALAALHALAAARLPVVAITGRPLGWSAEVARDWPVAAVVAENGAVALIRDGAAPTEGHGQKDGTAHGPRSGIDADDAAPRWRTEYAQDEPTRAANALRLREAAARVLREVPGATLARDSAGRVCDIAVDHGEFAHLDPSAIARVVAVMRAEGMNATVSSIHVNGWFGAHSKWSAAQWMLRRLFGRELEAEIGRWIYVGDSTNDQLMFEHFPLSVGVANLRRFAAELRVWPGWITAAERGAGFAELAGAVLAARR